MVDDDGDPGEDGAAESETLRDPTDIEVALRAGAALFNEGFVLAAHDPWEAAWLPRNANDDDDERLLHGLIATAAATHHASNRNWAGAVGCAENADEYLTPLEATCRGLALNPVREWCRRLASDPETIERRSPPLIQFEGTAIGFADLDLAATAVAAPVVAEAVPAADEAVVSAAADLAREEYGTGRSAVAELLFAFLGQPDARPQIVARLADHVDRAERKRRDVDGLFE